MVNPLAASLVRDADRVEFARSLGLEPDPWQKAVLRDRSKRKVIVAARQTGKSTTSAVLALHKASVFPGSTILVAAPSQRQALILFRAITGFYKRQHPEHRVGDELLKLRLELKNGSRIYALHGQEKTLRGFTADMIIADEAARLPDDGALIQALSPALSTRQGTLILISTPAGDVGYFRDCFYSSEWSSHLATVEECPRISEEFLASERATMPRRMYEQEYLCRFIAAPGAVFTTEDIDQAFTDAVTPVMVPSKVLGRNHEWDQANQ